MQKLALIAPPRVKKSGIQGDSLMNYCAAVF